jgi:hypothetical protein
MRESDLKECEEMWTTNRHNYVITDDRRTLPSGHQMGYGIFELSKGQLLVVLIEDTELHNIIAQRMMNAGVKVVPDVKAALALARASVQTS